jgi:hypothetical protein
VLKYAALLVLSFFLVAEFVGAILHRMGLDDHDLIEAKIEHAAREKPNMVFIGASFVDMGLNPDTFDEVAAKHGIATRSFNLGIDGLSVVEMRYVLDRLLDRLPGRLRYAVVVPCFECLNVARDTNNTRSINFFSLIHSIAFIRFIFSIDELPDPQLPRLQYVGNIVSAMFRHYTNLGLGGVALGWHQLERAGPNLQDAAFWKQRGPHGHRVVHQVMTAKDQAIYSVDVPRVRVERSQLINALSSGRPQDGVRYLVTDKSFEFFVRIMADLRARGVAVMVAQPPNFWQWDYEASFVAKIRARCDDNFPMIDYGNVGAHEDLFLPPKIRYDNSHLNTDGATIWSDDLAEDFANLLGAGAFDRPSDCLLSSPVGRAISH